MKAGHGIGTIRGSARGTLFVFGVAHAAAFLGLAAVAPAAPLERDLGQGLGYFRIHSVPADLPADPAIHNRPCVLDVRYARATGEAAAVLEGWLKFHASSRTPVFALVNASTAPAILAAFAHRTAIAGLIVIGIAGQKFAPDITVDQSARDERRAYDALERGATVAALTTDHPDKQRNDEASLARDRAPEAETDDSDPAEVVSESAAPETVREPPIDAALQMAVDLDRGLRAMKKL